MQQATEALRNADLVLAEHVIGQDDALTHRRTQLEADVFTVLARPAPVAGDRRTVVSAHKDITDVERMGACCRHASVVAVAAVEMHDGRHAWLL
ncbi:PhoU domain-containing protein [Mycobacterium sp. MAA66]|uniref:PhoU domain-containing protein n=1 Tax=Mycobacterium sp. MAA66 TaxID=3156297 RepID=UPI0035173929